MKKQKRCPSGNFEKLFICLSSIRPSVSSFIHASIYSSIHPSIHLVVFLSNNGWLLNKISGPFWSHIFHVCALGWTLLSYLFIYVTDRWNSSLLFRVGVCSESAGVGQGGGMLSPEQRTAPKTQHCPYFTGLQFDESHCCRMSALPLQSVGFFPSS